MKYKNAHREGAQNPIFHTETRQCNQLHTSQQLYPRWTVERIERAVTGDRELLTRLFDDIVPVIVGTARVALRRFGVPYSGDFRVEEGDVVTEVATRLLAHGGRELRRWDPERGKTLFGFVRLVTSRYVATLMGRVNRKCSVLTGFDDAYVAAQPGSNSRIEVVQLLRQVDERLAVCASPRDQQMFRLWSQGWKACEIGTLLGMKENSVARQLGRLRQRLQRWSHAYA